MFRGLNRNVVIGVIVCTILSFIVCEEDTCELEVGEDVPVVWKPSPPSNYVVSDPPCFTRNGSIVSRQCNGTWDPALNDLPQCKPNKTLRLSECPPGYEQVMESESDFCFEILTNSPWNFPCYRNGATRIIEDLDDSEFATLLQKLKQLGHQYYWLPASRAKSFNPVLWQVPGKHWGTRVSNSISLVNIQLFHFKKCLVIDVFNRTILTESCEISYPALCLYVNKIELPQACPDNYHASRFANNKSMCYGIEESATVSGNSWSEFTSTQCNMPVTYNPFQKFFFVQLAKWRNLPSANWCWLNIHSNVTGQSNTTALFNLGDPENAQGVINRYGTVIGINMRHKLPCMVCAKSLSVENVELLLEYNDERDNLFLTIYTPTSLWRDKKDDKGVKCFSNAKGFHKDIELKEGDYINTFVNMSTLGERKDKKIKYIQKVVYEVELSDKSGEYWCEGHLKNFTLVQTEKLLIIPNEEDEHIFSLRVLVYNVYFQESSYTDNEFNKLEELTDLIKDILDAKKVLVMDIISIDTDMLDILLHIHSRYNSDEDDDRTEGLKVQWIYEILHHRAIERFPYFNITFVSLTSSTHCLPTTTSLDGLSILNWEYTKIGQIVAPYEFCLKENGLPVKRHCSGTYLNGGMWQDVEGECSLNYEASNTTALLYLTAKGKLPANRTSSFLTNDLSLLLSDTEIFIPADIFYLAMSLLYVLSVAHGNTTFVEMGDLNNLAWMVDRVMGLDVNYLKLAQTLNSTNMILDSIDEILMFISSNDTTDITGLITKPLQMSVKPQFVAQITYPMLNNITGLALVNEKNVVKFNEMEIIPLYANTSILDVLSIENLEVAIWMPYESLNSLQPLTNTSTEDDRDSLHITISIFYSDAVFQEVDDLPHSVNGRVIGMTIPGFDTNLAQPVFMVFRDINQTAASRECSYWDFKSKHESTSGAWSNKGCYYVTSENNLTTCGCFHLTHFAQLMINSRKPVTPEFVVITIYHQKALNVITLIGCTLSLMGVAGIAATAIIFRSWRQKPSTKVLLQLSAASAFQLIIIVILNMDLNMYDEVDGMFVIADGKRSLCVALGAMLHYSVLTAFTWMLITAILQFLRYVRVLGSPRPPRFMFKFMLIGWGAPFIPVAILLGIDTNSYIPNLNDATVDAYMPICYPSGIYFIGGIVIPVGCILITNIIVFVLVIHSILHGPDGKIRSADTQLAIAQLRLSILLFFLLGLSWIFGFFTLTSNTIWISYIFCITATMQGFVLFIYFVVCDPATRFLWLSLMKPYSKQTDNSRDISNTTTTT